MAVTIDKPNEDKQHLFELLRNQTSIIDSTINIIRKGEGASQKTFSNVQAEMNLLANKVKKEEDVAKATHIPPSRALPIPEDNLTEFFKLMTSKGSVMRNNIIFEIHLPLVDLQQYNLFNMIPIPMFRYGQFISISIKSAILAVNAHRDEFISLTADEMHNCIHTTNDVFICNKQIKLNKGDRSHVCKVNFFLNKSSEACDLESTVCRQPWRQMVRKNRWMFTLANITELTFACGTKITHLEAQGAGTLDVGPDCTLKDNAVTIYGHYDNKTIVHTSYLRLKALETIASPSKLLTITLSATWRFAL
ncbi:uncharacterized protein [Musca autumnalis]|uniref:uncharacterized protein n=1 Tax=Musca autumnalis TaxID=221902 RepID=UPI003CED316C